MTFLDTMGPVLAGSAKERVKQTPVRLLLAAVMAWALNSGGMAGWIPLWLTVTLMVQGFELFGDGAFSACDAIDGSARDSSGAEFHDLDGDVVRRDGIDHLDDQPSRAGDPGGSDTGWGGC